MATVLIVDDASFMRNSLKYIIENAGHTVSGTAKDGEEALKEYRKHKPDVITLDILMTGMDGFATLKSIIKEDPEARIIMVSAIGNEEKQEKARQLGAVGYIRKPFKQTEIVDEINRVMAIRKVKT